VDKEAIAAELAALGRSDSKLLAKLEANRARRCAILSQVALHADTGLDATVAAASVQPKD
jgi:hypothetical protein